jgi:hypothetical protein
MSSPTIAPCFLTTLSLEWFKKKTTPFWILKRLVSTTKSRELTRPRCMQVECNIMLESFWRKLQLCYKPHPNQRFEQRVMSTQNCRNPNRDSFGILPWESRDKKPFRCRGRREAQRILYGGRWWRPPSLGHGESCESRAAHGLS